MSWRRKSAVTAMVGIAILSSGVVRAAGVASHDNAKSPYKIAFIQPYSGDTAYYGQYADEAWQLATAKYGHAVNGHPLQVTKFDDKCTPTDAVHAARQVTGSGFLAIIGPTCTGAVEASLPLLAASHIPHITVAFGSDITHKGDRFVWRAETSNTQLNVALARYLAQHHVKHIAIVHDTTGFSLDLDTTATAAFSAHGTKVDLDVAYTYGGTDFSGQIERIKSAGIHNVFLGGYDTDLGHFVAQAKQLGLQAHFYGPITASSQDFLSAAGAQQATGVTYVTDFVEALPVSFIRSFSKSWRSHFHRLPTSEAASFYTSAVAVLKALKKAGPNATAGRVNAGLRLTRLTKSPFGNVVFKRTGDLRCAPVIIGRWGRNGKTTVVKNYSPACAGLH